MRSKQQEVKGHTNDVYQIDPYSRRKGCPQGGKDGTHDDFAPHVLHGLRLNEGRQSSREVLKRFHFLCGYIGSDISMSCV